MPGDRREETMMKFYTVHSLGNCPHREFQTLAEAEAYVRGRIRRRTKHGKTGNPFRIRECDGVDPTMAGTVRIFPGTVLDMVRTTEMQHASDSKIVATLTWLHMVSPEASEIMAQLDWSQVWPRVDEHGILTGQVLDSDADLILVDWGAAGLTVQNGHACEAAILRCEAPEHILAEHRACYPEEYEV